ncbi:unnamed protein product [Spodoptera exigua]|nr:unnamed protein product [Spodoptera exigua]
MQIVSTTRSFARAQDGLSGRHCGPFRARADVHRPRTLVAPTTNHVALRAPLPLADIVIAEKAVGKTTDEFVCTDILFSRHSFAHEIGVRGHTAQAKTPIACSRLPGDETRHTISVPYQSPLIGSSLSPR